MKLSIRQKPNQKLAIDSVRRRSLPVDGERLANPAFSYYSRRTNDTTNVGRKVEGLTSESTTSTKPSDMSKHRRAIRLITLLALPVLLYGLYLRPEPQVILNQDAVTAYFLQDKSVYQQAATVQLQRSLFSRSKLTLDTAAVRLALLKNYPEIKSVTIRTPIIGHTPAMYIEPYKPSFLLTTTASTAFLLDATGRALATASQIESPNKLNVPTLQDKTGLVVQVGSRALPSTTVIFTQSVVQALRAKGAPAASLVISSANQLDVRTDGSSYFIKFNLQDNPLQQVGAYLAAKNRLVSNKIAVNEYIDVRVPERAYYK